MKTYNVELIFPTTQEKQDWIDFLKIERNIFDEISKISFLMPNRNNSKLFHDATYFPIRGKFPELNSHLIVCSQNSVKSAYKTIATNKHKIDRPITKKNLSCRLDKALYSKFTTTSIKLISKISHHKVEAKFKLYPKIEELLETASVHDPLIFCRNDRLFLAITFDIPEILQKNEDVLGIDLGMRRLFTTSDGLALSGKEYL